jgi:hypothetical protein
VTVPADPAAVVENKRLALAALGRELVGLFDEHERPDSPVTAGQIHTAVRSEATRRGIDLDRRGIDGVDKRAANAVLAAFEKSQISDRRQSDLVRTSLLSVLSEKLVDQIRSR